LEKYAPPSEQNRQLFSQLGGDQFDQLRTYLYEMSNMIGNQKVKLRQSHQEELELFPLGRDLTNKVYLRHYINYDSHFVGILFNSSLVSAYSIFESVFVIVCEYASELKSVPIYRSKLKTGNLVKNCKDFIEKDIGLDLSQIEEYWDELASAQKLRNKIVHHSATFSTSNEPLIKHIEASDYLHIEKAIDEELSFYIKDKMYLFDYIETSSSYLLWILMRL